MFPRRQFAFAGLSAVAAAGSLQTLLTAAEKDQHKGHGASDGMMKCAAACSDCQRECSSCAAHCATQLREGHSDHAATLATCQDCADICSAASQIVSRGGPFAEIICKACVDTCSKCAAACKKFPDDEHMTNCASECLDCEKACREMIA